MQNTWLGRRGTCSGTHSVESRPDADNDYRPWNRVREAGSRSDGSSTDGVKRVASRIQSRSTRPTAGDNVGTAAARRTAGRGRDEAQSLTATMCQRRPSKQLTPSHRLDGDARERQHVSPFTYNAGRHSISSDTHTDGSASARPSGNSDSHSDSQPDNFVDDYWVTFIHPLSSASGAQF